MIRIAMFAAASALLTGSANAELIEVTAPPSERVSYADLDLTSAFGKARLRDRIHAAVAHVCPEPSRTSAEMTMLSRECRGTALVGALRQMKQAIARSEDRLVIAATVVIAPGE